MNNKQKVDLSIYSDYLNSTLDTSYLEHHGIKGMKWGVHKTYSNEELSGGGEFDEEELEEALEAIKNLSKEERLRLIKELRKDYSQADIVKMGLKKFNLKLAELYLKKQQTSNEKNIEESKQKLSKEERDDILKVANQRRLDAIAQKEQEAADKAAERKKVYEQQQAEEEEKKNSKKTSNKSSGGRSSSSSSKKQEPSKSNEKKDPVEKEDSKDINKETNITKNPLPNSNNTLNSPLYSSSNNSNSPNHRSENVTKFVDKLNSISNDDKKYFYDTLMGRNPSAMNSDLVKEFKGLTVDERNIIMKDLQMMIDKRIPITKSGQYDKVIFKTTPALEHHGIKGMKWGIRRTPAQLDHKIRKITSKFKSKHKTKTNVKKTDTEQTTVSNSVIGRSKKSTKLTPETRYKIAEKILRKADPELAYKYRKFLTTKELQDLKTRLQAEQDIKKFTQHQVESGTETISALSSKITNTAKFINSGSQLWNSIAAIQNAYAGKYDDVEKLPIISIPGVQQSNQNQSKKK